MNLRTASESQDYGIEYTEAIVCEKNTDSSAVSDCFMNLIKNSTIIQLPVDYLVSNK